jgi:hypothetical protein
MANHCWNYAVFSGEERKLKQLIGSLNKVREDFGKEVRELYDNNAWIYASNGHILLGTPPPQKNSDGNLVDFDVYDEYGSRWFDCMWDVIKEGTKITSVELQGDSAWSPMLPLFEKICKRMNLKCYGNYSEPGMDFAGDFEMDSTGIVSHEPKSYREYLAESNPDLYWEDIVNWITDGYYDSVEEIFTEFAKVNWTLSDGEKVEIEEIWNKCQEDNKD